MGNAEHNREKYHRRRRTLIALLGGECAHCGAVDTASCRLQFDHIEASTKALEVGKHLASTRWAVILAEAVKLQLLCPLCHARKTMRARDWAAVR